ncbi:hypothetical protein ABXN37_04530 [Piscinibacter sakaiensis]|uniref:hypothetical protein n=1 Tax=Piscinibacter sakaiensis TaxID=1547922 RepID=UPI001E33A48B|nr:hypothetical protein [Piscinibacter sakaiensis]
MALTGLPAPTVDGRSFTGIYLAAFAVLLAIALLAQLVAAPWRSWFPGAEAEKSLVGGVRAAVYTFMSHLI